MNQLYLVKFQFRQIGRSKILGKKEESINRTYILTKGYYPTAKNIRIMLSIRRQNNLSNFGYICKKWNFKRNT
jgi:hypothetical protein